MTAIIDYQQAFYEDSALLSTLPDVAHVTDWASAVLSHLALPDKEMTVRFVNNDESQQLNDEYRGKCKPTNVLSFPFECPPEITLNLLGDLVLCVPVIAQEAREQQKPIAHHYAHMIVHGTLHLLGFDHIEDQQADQMEALEIAILAKIGIDDPYQDD